TVPIQPSPAVSTIRKLSNMRSARTFSPQLGHSTLASGSASLVSKETPHAGHVCRVDALNSAAIGPIVTSAIFRAMKLIRHLSPLPLRRERLGLGVVGRP